MWSVSHVCYMACKACSQTQHEHDVQLCRVVEACKCPTRATWRTCDCCRGGRPPFEGRHFLRGPVVLTAVIAEWAGDAFTGLQCTLCRNWDWCYTCVSKRLYPGHRYCGGRLTVWEMLISTVVTEHAANSKVKAVQDAKQAKNSSSTSDTAPGAGVVASRLMLQDRG